MAEPNPQPEVEVAAPTPPPKGGGIMGPVLAAIIVVAGVAGIFNIMVVPVLNPTEKVVSSELSDGDQNEEENSSNDANASGKNIKVPYELDEAILVNIKGVNNKVLSVKVGFLLKTKVKAVEVKDLRENLDKFKSMLVAAARGYFVGLDEDDLNVPEKVHLEQLKSKLNIALMKVRSYDVKLGEHLEVEPVEEVFLPYFTHQ